MNTLYFFFRFFFYILIKTNTTNFLLLFLNFNLCYDFEIDYTERLNYASFRDKPINSSENIYFVL